MNLIYSPEALRDLRGIALYGRRTFGKAKATAYIEVIERCLAKLATGQLHGRSAGHIAEGLRRQIVGSHVIFFRLVVGGAAISRILHEAMDHEEHL